MLLRIAHPTPLLRGRFRARYDRFIAEIDLDSGERIRAHCVNPGRMEGIVRPGARAWVSKAPPERKRKLAYTWELVDDQGLLMGANTVAPNRIVETLLRARVLSGLKRYRNLRREVRYAEGSRADFLLEGSRPHFVEVKNCHLVYPDGRGYFPDSVSARAAHHMEALAEARHDGAKCTVVFVVQRPDARAVRPSRLHDPNFAEAAWEAWRAGVRFRALRVRVTPKAYEVLDEIPAELRRYDASRLVPWRAEKLPYSGWIRSR